MHGAGGGNWVQNKPGPGQVVSPKVMAKTKVIEPVGNQQLSKVGGKGINGTGKQGRQVKRGNRGVQEPGKAGTGGQVVFRVGAAESAEPYSTTGVVRTGKLETMRSVRVWW